MLIILWILGALFVAAVFGAARTIGFWGCFLISLIVSPLLGLIITLFFKTTEDDKREKQQLQLQQQQVNLLKENSAKSIPEQLEHLFKLKESGAIKAEEYELLKQKIMK
jgi:membrane protein implicated in regulation of membrane protease activity